MTGQRQTPEIRRDDGIFLSGVTAPLWTIVKDEDESVKETEGREELETEGGKHESERGTHNCRLSTQRLSTQTVAYSAQGGAVTGMTSLIAFITQKSKKRKQQSADKKEMTNRQTTLTLVTGIQQTTIGRSARQSSMTQPSVMTLHT